MPPDTIAGLLEGAAQDVLFVVDAGGPAIALAAAPVAEIHVFERLPADTPARLTSESPAPLDRFAWRRADPGAPPRQILSHGRLLEELPALTGIAEARIRLLLSVPDWDAALRLLRTHGPLGMPRAAAILTAAPVGDAPLDALEELLDGAQAMLADTAGGWRALGRPALPAHVAPDVPGARFADVTCEAGLISARLCCEAPLPDGVMVIARHGADPVAVVRPRPLDATGRRFSIELELPRSLQFDIAVPSVTLHLATVAPGRARMRAPLPARRYVDAAELLDADPAAAIAPGGRAPFGILLLHDRMDSSLPVLESLGRQGALPLVELWMDGAQGDPARAARLDGAERRLAELGLCAIRRHHGALGRDRLALHALFHMCTRYDRFAVFEGTCFPTENAVAHLRAALDRHAGDADVATVYGNRFGLPCETDTCPRFQPRGWAGWSDRLLSLLQDLAYLYSLPEPAYLDWVASVLTPDIEAAVDCTAPQRASDTLRRYFAWDETLGLLAALRDLRHAPTARRCILDFGLDGAAGHPAEVDRYRAPPFNMIFRDEIWAHFHEPAGE